MLVVRSSLLDYRISCQPRVLQMEAWDLDTRFHEELKKFSGNVHQAEGQFLDAMENACRDGAMDASHQFRMDASTSPGLFHHLTAEADTWKLMKIRRSQLDHSQSEGDEVLDHELEEMVEWSALQVLREKMERKREFRRLWAIVHWLEQLHEKDLWELQDEVSGVHGTELWPSTVRKFKHEGRKDVTALDPDYPYSHGFNQARGAVPSFEPLAPTDEKEDLLLLQRIWRLLLAGRHDLAVDLCRRCGQPWRAATLEGGQLWDHENHSISQTRSRSLVRHNNIRPLHWHRACSTVARKLMAADSKGGSSRTLATRGGQQSLMFKVGRMEAAVYGSLGLDTEVVLQSECCQSWEDRCWAVFRAKMEWEVQLVLHRLRKVKEVRSMYYADLEDSEAEDGFLQKGIELKHKSVGQIFEELKASARATRGVGGMPDLTMERQAQAGTIRGELHDVILAMPDTVLETRNGVLRLWTHLALFVEVVDPEAVAQLPAEVTQRIWRTVTRYVEHLMRHGGEHPHVALTPLYISFLPVEQRRETLTKCMKRVFLDGQRLEYRERSLNAIGPDVAVCIAGVMDWVCDADDAAIDESIQLHGEKERAELEQLVKFCGNRERIPIELRHAFRMNCLRWLAPQEDPRKDAGPLALQSLVHFTALFRSLLITSIAEGGAPAVMLSQPFRAAARFVVSVLNPDGWIEMRSTLDPVQTVNPEDEDAMQFIGGYIDEWRCWKALVHAQEMYLKWQAKEHDFDIKLRVAKSVQAEGLGRQEPQMDETTGLLMDLYRLAVEMSRAARSAGKALLTIVRSAKTWLWFPVNEGDIESLKRKAEESMEPDPRLEAAVQVFTYERMRQRQKGLATIRATVLPELVRVLHQVFHRTGQDMFEAYLSSSKLVGGGEDAKNAALLKTMVQNCFAWSLHLAELVASTQTHLHELFPRGSETADPEAKSLLSQPFTLESLMMKMRDSATSLLAVAEYSEWPAIMHRAWQELETKY